MLGKQQGRAEVRQVSASQREDESSGEARSTEGKSQSYTALAEPIWVGVRPRDRAGTTMVPGVRDIAGSITPTEGLGTHPTKCGCWCRVARQGRSVPAQHAREESDWSKGQVQAQTGEDRNARNVHGIPRTDSLSLTGGLPSLPLARAVPPPRSHQPFHWPVPEKSTQWGIRTEN